MRKIWSGKSSEMGVVPSDKSRKISCSNTSLTEVTKAINEFSFDFIDFQDIIVINQ